MDATAQSLIDQFLFYQKARSELAVIERAQRLLPGDEEVIAECEGSLLAFCRHAWPILEPQSREFKEGWAIGAIAEHLEAVTDGEILRLLVNVPPGMTKPISIKETITTLRGRIRLADIVVGDMVLTHKQRFKSVTAVHEQGVLPVVKVNTIIDRSVIAAPDHPFLTMRGWIQAGHLTSSDFLIVVTPEIFMTERVFSVEAAGSEQCRCLSVEDDHSFVVNDFAVHNSLMTKVFWPAWEWGPKRLPWMRYITASYAKHLSLRDARKMKRIIDSPWYQRLWPEVKLSHDQKTKSNFETVQTGFMLATSIGGVGTGERGDRFLVDDPNNVKEAESDSIREGANEWMKEVVPSRVNDPMKSAIIVIQQRTHEHDVSGFIIEENDDDEYVHLSLPMKFEKETRCITKIGFRDPRTKEGEMLFPERFPAPYVLKEMKRLGPYGASAQYQQRPTPRGGGIIRLDDWQMWDKSNPEAVRLAQGMGITTREFPRMEFVIGSLDTAFTEEEENDHSANSIIGVWRHPVTRQPQAMLMYSWEGREHINPLVMKIAAMNARYRVNKQIIEVNAAGHSVAQEIKRLFSSTIGTVLIAMAGGRGKSSPTVHRGDKSARAYTVQHIWTNGQVWRPNTIWAQKAAEQLSRVPKTAEDDIADTLVTGIRWLRDTGFLLTPAEGTGEVEIYGKALQAGEELPYDV